MPIAVRSLQIAAVILACLISFTARAEATSMEVDAAVARMASAAYKIEVLSACGLPKSEDEKVQVQQFAMAMALQPEGLSRKLSTAQFVHAAVRARNKEFMASMQARAKLEATPEECSKPETSALWDNLIRFKESLRKPSTTQTQPGGETKLPPGAIREGSLANAQLVQDAKLGIAGKAGTLGCKEIGSYRPFVLAMPEGSPGSRVWHEQWIVTCEGKDYPIAIRFNESGSASADYRIE